MKAIQLEISFATAGHKTCNVTTRLRLSVHGHPRARCPDNIKIYPHHLRLPEKSIHHAALPVNHGLHHHAAPQQAPLGSHQAQTGAPEGLGVVILRSRAVQLCSWRCLPGVQGAPPEDTSELLPFALDDALQGAAPGLGSAEDAEDAALGAFARMLDAAPPLHASAESPTGGLTRRLRSPLLSPAILSLKHCA